MTAASPDQRVNAADYPCLAVLSLAPAHGYDVWRYFRDNLGNVWSPGRSQIYALLAQLERDGLVYHERVDQANLPSRKVFYLTEKGHKVLDDWMSRPVDHVRDCRLELPGKLHFAAQHSEEKASRLIQDQVALFIEKRQKMADKRARCQTEIERQVMDYRISVMDVTLTWLDGVTST